MATFNEINAGRFNRFAQKLFNMKGGTSVPTLSPDLMLIMAFSSGIENRYLEGWDQFANSKNIALFAANFAALNLRNPTGSNVMAVIESALLSEIVVDAFATFVKYPRGAAGAIVDQTNIRVTQSLDPRGRPASTCILTDSSGVATINQVGGIVINGVNTPANSAINLMPAGREVPLLPGEAISISAGTAAQAMLAGFWWRERALEDSEIR